MDHKQLLSVLVALLIGFGGGYVMWGTPNADKSMMGHSMDQQMDTMMSGLSGKTSDEFDKAFLLEMIEHHEGAVEMAEAALANAKHDEIKQMAHAIISAQMTEIAQMKAWLSVWYGQ